MEWKLYLIQGIEFIFLGIGSYYDVKNQELSLRFLLPFLSISIFSNLILRYQSQTDWLIGGCIGCVFLGVGWLTKEEIGYGDGIGLVILGILKGWRGLIPMMFMAFLLSGIYGEWKLIGLKESSDSVMPFFPFLLIASVGMILI